MNKLVGMHQIHTVRFQQNAESSTKDLAEYQPLKNPKIYIMYSNGFAVYATVSELPKAGTKTLYVYVQCCVIQGQV